MRVIAGFHKGRRLRPPTWDGLRPTSDKLRETLFNVLAPRLPGCRVLDGYAGTGAIGIEAISRGAEQVTFVERDPRAVALIRENLAGCGIRAGYTIEHGDVGAAFEGMRGDVTFDIIVLDPPYASGVAGSVLEAAGRRLAADGVLVLERPTRVQPEVPSALARVRDITSGDSTLTLLQRTEERA